MTLESTSSEFGIQHPTSAELEHARQDVLNRWQEQPAVLGPLDQYGDTLEAHFMHPETLPYLFSVKARIHGLVALSADSLRAQYDHAVRAEQ